MFRVVIIKVMNSDGVACDEFFMEIYCSNAESTRCTCY